MSEPFSNSYLQSSMRSLLPRPGRSTRLVAQVERSVSHRLDCSPAALHVQNSLVVPVVSSWFE